MMLNYFKVLFKKDNMCDVGAGSRGCFPTPSQETMEDVMRKITDKDIKQAITDMAPLKSPGLDGMHAVFYQKLWPIVGNKVVEMEMEFFNSGNLPKGLNDTIITLFRKWRIRRSQINLGR